MASAQAPVTLGLLERGQVLPLKVLDKGDLTSLLLRDIHLDRWEQGKEYDRLGLDRQTHNILGVDVPYLEIPVAPGRNLAMLVEVAARSQLLRLKGYVPGRDLAEQLDAQIAAREPDEA